VPRSILRAESLFNRNKTFSLRDKLDEFVKGFPALKFHQRVIENKYGKGEEEKKETKNVA